MIIALAIIRFTKRHFAEQEYALGERHNHSQPREGPTGEELF